MQFGLALILLSTFSFAASSPPYGKVISVQGTVTVVESTGANGIPLKKMQELASGVEIVTGERSFARLQLQDESVINIAPSTSLLLKQTEKEKISLLELVGGTIRAQVTKATNQDQEKLIVTTKTSAMGIRGTDFLAAYDAAAGTTTLETVEGKVAFAVHQVGANPVASLRKAAVIVPAGHSSTGAANVTPTKPAPIPAERLQQLKTNSTVALANPLAKKPKRKTNIPNSPPNDSEIIHRPPEVIRPDRKPRHK